MTSGRVRGGGGSGAGSGRGLDVSWESRGLGGSAGALGRDVARGGLGSRGGGRDLPRAVVSVLQSGAPERLLRVLRGRRRRVHVRLAATARGPGAVGVVGVVAVALVAPARAWASGVGPLRLSRLRRPARSGRGAGRGGVLAGAEMSLGAGVRSRDAGGAQALARGSV